MAKRKPKKTNAEKQKQSSFELGLVIVLASMVTVYTLLSPGFTLPNFENLNIADVTGSAVGGSVGSDIGLPGITGRDIQVDAQGRPVAHEDEDEEEEDEPSFFDNLRGLDPTVRTNAEAVVALDSDKWNKETFNSNPADFGSSIILENEFTWIQHDTYSNIYGAQVAPGKFIYGIREGDNLIILKRDGDEYIKTGRQIEIAAESKENQELTGFLKDLKTKNVEDSEDLSFDDSILESSLAALKKSGDKETIKQPTPQETAQIQIKAATETLKDTQGTLKRTGATTQFEGEEVPVYEDKDGNFHFFKDGGFEEVTNGNTIESEEVIGDESYHITYKNEDGELKVDSLIEFDTSTQKESGLDIIFDGTIEDLENLKKTSR